MKTEKEPKPKTSVKGLKKRPAYDPLIEDLNQKAQDKARERQSEIKASETRIEQSAEGRQQGLIDHGKRINPDKFQTQYIGSLCVHVYRQPLPNGLADFNMLSMNAGEIPQFIATKALDHLHMTVRESYGHAAGPRSLDKAKQQARTTKKES